jgi:hypothetical protein
VGDRRRQEKEMFAINKITGRKIEELSWRTTITGGAQNLDEYFTDWELPCEVMDVFYEIDWSEGDSYNVECTFTDVDGNECTEVDVEMVESLRDDYNERDTETP